MSDQLKLVAKVDGSGNSPRGSAAGAVVFDIDGNVLKEKAISWGKSTNNVAEYKAVILGIEVALSLEADELEILSDSQLIVNQVQGNWDCKDIRLQDLRDSVQSLGDSFDYISIAWIPREQNSRADYLAGKALKEYAEG
jgi:ribonuclease HI